MKKKSSQCYMSILQQLCIEDREKPYNSESYLSFIVFSFERILALDAYFLAKAIITSDLNHPGGCLL